MDDIVFDRGKIDYQDAIAKADIHLTVNPLGKSVAFAELTGSGDDKQAAAKTADNYIFGWKADGTYNNEPLSGSGKIGGMLALRNAGAPFSLQADVRSGGTCVAFTGTLEDPLNFGGLDLRLRLAGENLGDLQGLTGVVLPDSPPYNTDGHLVATFKGKSTGWYRYDEKFNGKIGQSDIHGTLEYRQGKPRPSLTGELVSNRLRFADFGALIGADFETASGKQQPKPSRYSCLIKCCRMINSIPPAGPRWMRMSSLPARIWSMAMRCRVDLHARGLQLKALFPNVEAMRSSMGQLNGDAQFNGTGNSVAALLGSSNGNLRLLMNDGIISRNLMEIARLNVGNYVVGKLFGDAQVKINCAAADDNVNNGLAQPLLFLFDTENTIIHVDGTTNFGTERLDLSINPESKGARIVTL